MNRLEFIFKTMNKIASNEQGATIRVHLAQAVLNDIDVAK